MFTAVLDTCVLWSSLQRDFLLSLAVEGLYRPIWSGTVLDELEYEEAAKLRKRGASEEEALHRGAHLISEMRRRFNDAEIPGWEPLEGSYGLPDPNDEHLVAVAVVGQAGAIVTLNLGDFPVELLPSGIEAISPSEFARNTVDLNPRVALRAVKEIVSRSGRRGREMSVNTVLNDLVVKHKMRDAVDLMRQYL